MSNIIVTGASKGLGLAITRKILEAGNTVFAISRSYSKELEILSDMYKGKVRFLSFDLAETDKIKKSIFCKDYINFDTPIHGFVNNAAKAYDDIITNANSDKLKDMYAVNVFSPIMITKYVIRHMLFHKIQGSIVHISSVSVHTGYKGLSMYASTKGALEAFSKNTAREWGSKKIRSNSLVAGFMETSMSSTLSDEQKTRIYNRTSLKQATEPDSVAAMTTFLLSEGAMSVTGQQIFVDSGTI